MSLEFDITMDEMMVFQRRALTRNRQFQKGITLINIFFPAFVLILLLFAVPVWEDGYFRWEFFVADIVVWGVFMAAFWLFYRRLVVFLSLRRVKRVMQSPKNSIYFKHRVMELGDEGLTLEMEESYDRLKWSLILEYEELETVFLMYVSEISAHIIPKRILSGEEAAELRTILKTHVAELTEKSK